MNGARPRIVVFAYACEPGRGSEPGAGWGVVRAIAEFADCVVLTGPEHAPALDRWQREHPASGLQFVTVPERTWPATHGRGRIGWFVAYLRWLPGARRTAAALHAEHPFDLAWHATYSTYWLPAPVHALGIPSVWGPVGGAVVTPRALWPLLGVRGLITEVVDLVAVRALAALPAVRRTWQRVSVRVAQNPQTLGRLGATEAPDARIVNHALFTEAPLPPQLSRGTGLVMACALESRKGVELALRAMVHTPADVRLTILGDGPQRRTLEQVAGTLGVQARVTFLGARPRAELQEHFARAAAVLFTGLREEGGLALAESMLAGAPVIVLGVGGARWIAEQATDPSRVTIVPPGDPAQTARSLAEAMTRAVRHVPVAHTPLLDRAAAVAALRAAATQALGLRATVPPVVGDAAPSEDIVTVVIPVYNGAAFLAAAVQSALSQTHQALRVVIVNDGSTDDTAAVAARLAGADARVQVVTIPNGGRARARNIGIASAPASPYVAFLDADDLWDREKLARQLAVLHARPDVLGVGSRMRYIASSGAVLGETGQEISDTDLRAIARGELTPFPISSCLVLRRETFDALGGFDEELREAEDLDFLARLARAGRIVGLRECLGAYRIHPASAMATSRATVNKYARFARQRLAMRDAGGDLRWADFSAAYRPSWQERRRDAIETWYRSAALWRGEGHVLRALRYGALAAVAAPFYTLRRVRRQQGLRHVAR